MLVPFEPFKRCWERTAQHARTSSPQNEVGAECREQTRVAGTGRLLLAWEGRAGGQRASPSSGSAALAARAPSPRGSGHAAACDPKGLRRWVPGELWAGGLSRKTQPCHVGLTGSTTGKNLFHAEESCLPWDQDGTLGRGADISDISPMRRVPQRLHWGGGQPGAPGRRALCP